MNVRNWLATCVSLVLLSPVTAAAVAIVLVFVGIAFVFRKVQRMNSSG